jgi:hypothetical protein
MASYRYILMKGSVPVGPAVPFDSDDDEEAIELMRLAMVRTDCELWRGEDRGLAHRGLYGPASNFMKYSLVSPVFNVPGAPPFEILAPGMSTNRPL